MGNETFVFDNELLLKTIKENKPVSYKGLFSFRLITPDDFDTHSLREQYDAFIAKGFTNIVPSSVNFEGKSYDVIVLVDPRDTLNDIRGEGEEGVLYGTLVVNKKHIPILEPYQGIIAQEVVDLLLNTVRFVVVTRDGRHLEFGAPAPSDIKA